MTIESNHTPGPWAIGKIPRQKDGVPYDSEITEFQPHTELGNKLHIRGPREHELNRRGKFVCQMPYVNPIHTGVESLKEHLANVNLVSAAPDLLLAAKNFLNGNSCEEALIEFEHAVNKAEGRL